MPGNRPDALRVYLIYQGAESFLFSLIFTFNLLYHTTVANLSAIQLVLVGTILESTVFLFEVPTGIVADVYSRRLSVVTGVFLIGVGFLVEGSLPVFWAIALAQVLWGVGYTFTSGATQAWISDEVGEERAATAFLRGSQVGQIGGLAGLLLSMLLAQVRVNLPILTGGGLFLLLALFLARTMPENGFKATPPAQRENWKHMAATFRSGLGMVRLRPALLTILAAGLFYGLYSEAYDRLWVKHLLDNLSLGSVSLPIIGSPGPVMAFGLLRLSSLALGIAATGWANRRLATPPAEAPGPVAQAPSEMGTRLSSHTGAAGVLLILTLGLILGLLAFALSSRLWVAVLAFWTISVTRTLIGPIYTAWVNQKLDSRVRATVISMSSQVDAIGQIAGGPLLGAAGSLWGVRAAIAAAGLVLSPILLIYRRALGEDGNLAGEVQTVD